MPPLPPAILLMGPTASGKTDLAIRLAERRPCELISVDSALVYRGMDIGTAKPTPAELARTPHRLIDICEPDESYSAARFRDDALAAMREITAAGRIPLLVGGTMLYFRALQYGLSALPEGDPAVRRDLEAQAAEHGWAWMHARLAEVDPASAARIHPNDPQRIERALEVHALTGRPLSEQQCLSGATALPWSLIKLARAPRGRATLHGRIAARFHAMLEAGFEAEVRGLMARYPDAQGLPAMRAVGYRQMIQYLRGECDRATMIERGIVATRQLAKRQLTWLRAEKDLHWIFDEEGDALALAQRILAERIGG